MFEDHFGDLVSQWSKEASDPVALEDRIQAREVRRWVESKLLPIPEPKNKTEHWWGDRRLVARRWYIMSHRYGLEDASCDGRLRSISKEQGVTYARISRIEQMTITWLRIQARVDGVHGGG
jgi:DNA-directed RNA polymerase sigma subunit (sigma70/sigma32)